MWSNGSSFLLRGRSFPGKIKETRKKSEAVPLIGAERDPLAPESTQETLQEPEKDAAAKASPAEPAKEEPQILNGDSSAPHPAQPPQPALYAEITAVRSSQEEVPSLKVPPLDIPPRKPELAKEAGASPASAAAASPSPAPSSAASPAAASPPPKAPEPSTHRQQGARATDSARVAKFKKELAAPSVNLDALREVAWNGVPPDMRPAVWRLLLGYAPPSKERRETVLARKRQEYREWVPLYYDIGNEDRTEDEVHTLRQILVDVPRTVPDVPFFGHAVMQTSLTRILYIWAIRHPASGYVQGINDLVTPFLTVFLSELFQGDISSWPVADLPPDTALRIEADCFWCLSKLLDGIQDHYTFAQPGIQRLVFKLKELVRRIDEPLSKHIEEQGLEFLQFGFRWFNCLLIREIPYNLVARLWDTYLAEGEGFAEYLVYVSASFMLTWTDQLQTLDFQEMVLFLQHLPTREWSVEELEMVLSRAFMWRVMFDRSPNHLISS